MTSLNQPLPKHKNKLTKTQVCAFILTALLIISLLLMLPFFYRPLLQTLADIKNSSFKPHWPTRWLKFNALFAALDIAALVLLHLRLGPRIAAILKSQLFLITAGISLFIKNYLATHFVAYSTGWEYLLHPFTLYWFLFLAFILAPAFFFGKRRPAFLNAANLLWSLLFFIYINYFRGFQVLPTTASLSSLRNFTGAHAAGGLNPFVLTKPYDFLLFLDLPLFIFWAIKKPARNSARRRFAAAVTLGLAAVLIIDAVLLKKRPIINQNVTLNSSNWIRKYSALGHFFVNEWEISTRKRHINADDKAQIEAWFQKNQALNEPGPYDGLLKNSNLLILAMESFDSFLIGRTYNGIEVTPHLNAMLAHSLYWPNIYEQTNANSIHGLMAIETSIYPPIYGIVSLVYPNTTFKEASLSGILSRNGYTSFMSGSGDGGGWKEDVFFQQTAYGVQRFYGRELDVQAMPLTDRSDWGLSDEALYRYSLEDIDQLRNDSDEPFAAFIFTSSLHMPFIYDFGGAMEKPFVTPRNSTLGNYLNNAHYADRQIKYLMDEMDKRGLLNNTLVAVTGDHTGLNKFYPGPYPDLEHMQPWEGQYALNQDLRVPFLLFNPNLQGRRFEQIGGQIDIAPTALSLLGISASEYGNCMFGRNLLGSSRSFALLANGQIQGEATAEEAAALIEGRRIADMLVTTDTADPSKR